MAEAYTSLLQDPEVLLTQLQGQAAASEPAVRDVLRRGFQMIFEMVEREWPASAEEIQAFFAHGMLCNVIAAMQIEDLHERWADVLTIGSEDSPCLFFVHIVSDQSHTILEQRQMSDQSHMKEDQ